MFFGFSLPRNRNRYIFFDHAKLEQLINFSCEGSVFLGQSLKRLSANRLRCEHRHFYKVTPVGLVLYILADLGPPGEVLTKQTIFLVQPYARFARIALQKFASQFSPATISLESLHKTHVCVRHQAIFKRYASEPIHDKLNRDKMADMIAAGADDVSNPRLQCTRDCRAKAKL